MSARRKQEAARAESGPATLQDALLRNLPPQNLDAEKAVQLVTPEERMRSREQERSRRIRSNVMILKEKGQRAHIGLDAA